jgi:phosphocarrier protein HPr
MSDETTTESRRTVKVAAARANSAAGRAWSPSAAAAAGIPISLEFGTKTVNAASILGVLSLGVMQGNKVTLVSSAPGADAVLDGLVALLESPHD